jgi:hypothetical protein
MLARGAKVKLLRLYPPRANTVTFGATRRHTLYGPS